MSLRRASDLLQQKESPWLEQWVARLTTPRQRISSDTREQAKRVLMDCIGAMVAGQNEPDIAAFVQTFQAREGGTVAVIGCRSALRADDAAFLNGASGTALELDEGHRRARGHPAIHVVPAALAAAVELNASGEDILSSLVLGYEIAARAGAATSLRADVHTHGTWGILGAASAVATLHRAGPNAIIQCLNIAANLAAPTGRRAMLEGATLRNLYAGLSGRGGLDAWRLASAGITGETGAVATVFGKVLGEDFETGIAVQDWDTDWAIDGNYFKLHSACRYCHGPLDLIDDLANEGKLPPLSDIAAIEVETYPAAIQLDNTHPETPLAGRFSIPFAIATRLVSGGSGPDAFAQDRLKDSVTMDLAHKVSVTCPERYAQLSATERPCALTLTLMDGSLLRRVSYETRGEGNTPYSASVLSDKFSRLTSVRWSQEQIETVRHTVQNLERFDARALNTALMSPV